MEVSEGLVQQQRLQAIVEKRERMTEIENRKRQLEDDRRQLQHLKSKALRERWLLDGAPSGTPEQDEAKMKLLEDEAKTRELEDAILRMEQELEELETGVKVVSTKDMVQEEEEEVQITTIVSKAPGSVKVVHEMNGENGVHLLSSSEVDELLLKADEISMVSEPAAVPSSALPQATTPTPTLTPTPTPTPAPALTPEPAPPKTEITGLEAKSGTSTPQPGEGERGVSEASASSPVTMTFMGYQSVEDEAETLGVLGLEGTVKAELVVIEESGGEAGKTSPAVSDTPAVSEASTKEDQTAPPNGSTTTAAAAETDAEKDAEAAPAESGESKGEPEGGASEPSKEKQPCKCCTIM